MGLRDNYRGCLLGLAVGDAVGTTLEFRSRGSFTPLTDMVGGGPFGLEAGQWTDDTSMALCLATSLLESGGFDPRDQMERYCRWSQEGYMSSTGTCFDIGATVAAALRRYRQGGDPYSGSADPWSAGNGSLMRLAPVPLFYFPDLDLVERFAVESSRTTHAAEECLDAARFLARAISRALAGSGRNEVLLGDAERFQGCASILALARGDYRGKAESEVRGSGYVVESLEAALWCFAHSRSFAEAVLKAANLGDDADTTAAICGQLAGAFYGESAIPPAWLEKLAMDQEIRALADRLLVAGPGRDDTLPSDTLISDSPD